MFGAWADLEFFIALIIQKCAEGLQLWKFLLAILTMAL